MKLVVTLLGCSPLHLIILCIQMPHPKLSIQTFGTIRKQHSQNLFLLRLRNLFLVDKFL